MKKFEYMIVNRELCLNDLENMGREGWELCGMRKEEIHESNYHVVTQIWYFKRELHDNEDYARLLIGCAYIRNVPQLQHRTIAEFAQFVEDVMSDKPEYEKYRNFDWNERDAIEQWIVKFHEYCKEYYSNVELLESETETLREIQEGKV